MRSCQATLCYLDARVGPSGWTGVTAKFALRPPHARHRWIRLSHPLTNLTSTMSAPVRAYRRCSGVTAAPAVARGRVQLPSSQDP
jgi:hypothetical protein